MRSIQSHPPYKIPFWHSKINYTKWSFNIPFLFTSPSILIKWPHINPSWNNNHNTWTIHISILVGWHSYGILVEFLSIVNITFPFYWLNHHSYCHFHISHQTASKAHETLFLGYTGPNKGSIISMDFSLHSKVIFSIYLDK